MDAKIDVRISNNKMEAYLAVQPASDGQPVSRRDIENALLAKGVVYGIRQDVLEQVLDKQKIREPVLIARGLKPIEGKNARINFKFNLDNRGKPMEKNDGGVDFYSLSLIQNVEEGEIIATKTPATPATFGFMVTGEELKVKSGKEIQMLAGKNVELREDGTVAAALVPGHATITGRKLRVTKLYQVAGDVDLNTGNIEFKGSVYVTGNIRGGFKVVANGDVLVMGMISDGIVECTGNVRVNNGIIGKKTSIKAEGSVITRFIENACVEAGESVRVGEAIMHSNVNAVSTVIVEGKGVIVGGSIRAGEKIYCKIAGSELAAVTELETGVTPELRREYLRLVKLKEEKTQQYDKAFKSARLLNRMKMSQQYLSADKLNLLNESTSIQAELTQELQEINEKLENMEVLLKNAEFGRVLVHGAIYPGVRLAIGTANMLMKDKCSFVSFSKQDEEIKIFPLK